MQPLLHGIPMGPHREPSDARTIQADLTTRFRSSGAVFHDCHDRLFDEFFRGLWGNFVRIDMDRTIGNTDVEREDAIAFFIDVMKLRGYRTSLSRGNPFGPSHTTFSIHVEMQ